MNFLLQILGRLAEVVLKSSNHILSVEKGDYGGVALRVAGLIGGYKFFVMPVGRWLFNSFNPWVRETIEDIDLLFPFNLLAWLTLVAIKSMVNLALLLAMVAGVILYIALFMSIVLYFIS